MKMSATKGNLNKLEDKSHTITDLMARKRKLYLLKRVQSVDGITDTENTAVTNVTNKKASQSLIKKAKSNSLSKCSSQNFYFTPKETTFAIGENHEERYNYENNPALRICNESNRLNDPNDCISPLEVNKNCSCNKNCHRNYRLPYHHDYVLKNKAAQKSLLSHQNNTNIYVRNSYYLLRNLYEQNSATTDKIKCETTKMSSASVISPTMSTSVQQRFELVPKFRNSKSHTIYFSTCKNICNNHFPRDICDMPFSTNKVSASKLIWQLCNIFMILKTLLLFVTKTPLSLFPVDRLTIADTEDEANKSKDNPYEDYQQNSYVRVKQRLTNVEDQKYCNRQKLQIYAANVSFSTMFLISLSFISIFLPLSEASSFENTLRSSLAAWDRVPRDVDLPSDLKNKDSLQTDQVRLAHSEYVCKSLDIRNTAALFQQLENCTVIEGLLLITLLNDNSLDDYNGTFPMLTEITDFLIIYQVNRLRSIGRIFPNLSVIRGRVLFEGYALIIHSNIHLEEIGLSKLMSISRGGVRIEKNDILCFVKSIDWSQIVSNTTDIVIEENRDTIECPACPGDQWSVGESAGQHVLSCEERHGRRHCWSSQLCQKFCPKRCKNNCIDENTCCNEACIGGCSPENLNECISCKNFSIYNTTCVNTCPDNYYKYLDRRCITAKACSIIGTKYENNQQEVLVAYDGSCSTSCPEGYTKDNTTCKKCRDTCTKKCEGMTIDTVASARKFHLCTHIINTPLVISIKRDGRHLMEDLAYGLSSIKVIKSSLKLQGTYGVSNLKFFKNLERIEGENLLEGKYALYALENSDIETLWNPNQTVKILRGTVFFHFNPKLCFSEIKSLLPMLNQTSFDLKEVSEDSNGSRGTCNTSLLNVTITSIGSLFALVKIHNPMTYVDTRTFIGYQYLYIEDPLGNATKHAFRPCSDNWEISEPIKNTTYFIQNLKPYTRYSYYVKTLTISTEHRNAQSEIQHFKTKSGQPQIVNKLQAYANSSSNIVMSWLPPTKVHGKLIKYKIRAVYDKRAQKLDSRNYCKDPLKEIAKPDIPISITEKPTVAKTCNCKKINTQIYDEEEIDANIHEFIELENALQNFVYVKRDNKIKINTTDVSSIELLEQTSSRSRRGIEGDPFDSFILRHMRDVPNEEMLAHDTTTMTSALTSISSTGEPHPDDNSFYEARLDPEGEYYEVVVDSVNASTTEYVFTKLKHFSWYMLAVKACRERDSGREIAPDCSIEVKGYARTLKLDNVDRVEDFRAIRETTNSSRSNIRIFWKRPTRPNGAIVSYTILYLLQSPDAVEDKKCITEMDYIDLEYYQNGYVLSNLNPGNYSIRISTNTLAGEGQYSNKIFIDIPPVTMPLNVIIGIIVGVLCVVFLIVLLVYYLCRRRILAPPSDLKIFPSVNPHYISLQYIPDEWEVGRDKVIQLNPLGQGSFGMVYEGILKGYKNSEEDTPCAIKTVNENATDRERMNFLNEACVMKQFDTYHVVRLLGVCSLGQPALVVMELMKKGDLKSYLRAHRPDERDETGMPLSLRTGISSQPPKISRIYQMAIEIADGMAYLAAKKFVHRDLAARNCMVAEDLTVKIGDFGMTRDIYENDYYRKGTKGLLPVRWMPPESLRDGIYSTSSDVFSYGVVLWEMSTLASQPYQGLSNDQVLRYVIDGGVMERPENCPDKLYSLMQKCWHHRPSARPTFIEIIRFLLDFADPHFREVSFYNSDEGQQILAREVAERSQHSGDIFDNLDNDIEDVTTPLRLEESSGYKLNMDNNSSVEHRGDSSMVIDDDDPHSTYSLTGSPIVVSSTPDEHVRNNFNMSRIINSHNQIFNSAPSTSAELRKTGSGNSFYAHPHTHPYHRNLYQPNRYVPQQQQARHHPDDVDVYVPPDFELKDLMEIKRESDEQGYEMYDPSPSDRAKTTVNVHDDDDDDLNVHSTAGQSLISRSKQNEKKPTIMPLSSSMPDEVIGQPQSSSLHPSTASAASSNASSKTGKYPSLRAVADSLGNNVTAKFRSILFNTHKRSGSNASHKSTSSNPNSATTSGAAGVGTGNSTGSSNNLTRGGRGKSISGHNLGTIESGGSGSAGSYCTNPRFYTSNKGSGGASDNPNYKRLDDGSGDALLNKSKLSSSAAFSMSSNPNYKVLDESLNTTGTSNSTHNPAINNSLQHTTDNPNYQLMQPPTSQQNENASSYVVMNEPKPSAISKNSNSNYQVMGPPPPPLASTGTMSSSVLLEAQSPATASRIGGGRKGVGGRFKKYSSSSSAVSTSSSHESDEDDNNVSMSKGLKSDRIPLSRRSSSDRIQKKKHSNNRSRSQSSSGSSRSSNTATTTSQHQQPSDNPTASIAASTLLTKENWLKQQPPQSHHRQPKPPPPPNGFVGREAS